MVDQQHPHAELAGPCGAEQAGGAGADDHRVEAGRHAQGASLTTTIGGVYFRWPT